MKSLRKRLLTLLALTLFGGAGAWAQQGPTNVTQFTTDLLPASWQDDYDHEVTLADLQALGFEAVDASVAQAWTGAPQGEYSWLIYGFNGGNCLVIPYDDSGDMGNPSYSTYTKGYLYGLVANGSKLFYTGSPEPAEIELTPNATGKVWTLGQTPDYDLELQVEYYQPHTLDSIPLGWQVKVGNAAPVYPTAYTEGNTSLGHLTITETDSVELIPPADVKPTVKSVTLTEVVAAPQLQTVNIDGVELQIAEGETWRQIAQRNPGVITADDDDNGHVYRDLDTVLRVGTAYIKPTDTYNSSLSYYWFEH